jgi:hypothetical protein
MGCEAAFPPGSDLLLAKRHFAAAFVLVAGLFFARFVQVSCTIRASFVHKSRML